MLDGMTADAAAAAFFFVAVVFFAAVPGLLRARRRVARRVDRARAHEAPRRRAPLIARAQDIVNVS